MEILRIIFSTALGLVIVGGLLAFIYGRQAESWQKFQPFYGQNWTGAVATRHMQSFLLYSKGDFSRSYSGVVTIGVFPNGIGFRFIRLLAPFHDPIFVPYQDIKGWQQIWYINAKSVELSFAKLPELRIIMPASQIAWIAKQGFANIDIAPEKPPTGNWPYATYISAMVLAAMAMTVLVISYIKADGDWAEMWHLLSRRGYNGG